MIMQERARTSAVPSEIAMCRRRLRLALVFAIAGLVVFVGSCAFSGTSTGLVLALGAIALGLVSIAITMAALKGHDDNSVTDDIDARHSR